MVKQVAWTILCIIALLRVLQMPERKWKYPHWQPFQRLLNNKIPHVEATVIRKKQLWEALRPAILSRSVLCTPESDWLKRHGLFGVSQQLWSTRLRDFYIIRSLFLKCDIHWVFETASSFFRQFNNRSRYRWTKFLLASLRRIFT